MPEDDPDDNPPGGKGTDWTGAGDGIRTRKPRLGKADALPLRHTSGRLRRFAQGWKKLSISVVGLNRKLRSLSSVGSNELMKAAEKVPAAFLRCRVVFVIAITSSGWRNVAVRV